MQTCPACADPDTTINLGPDACDDPGWDLWTCTACGRYWADPATVVPGACLT